MTKKNAHVELCFNCKYFLRYYIVKLTRFEGTLDGKCTCENLDSARKKEVNACYSCELWESNQEIRDEREKFISAKIWDIAREIDEMKQILADDRKGE